MKRMPTTAKLTREQPQVEDDEALGSLSPHRRETLTGWAAKCARQGRVELIGSAVLDVAHGTSSPLAGGARYLAVAVAARRRRRSGADDPHLSRSPLTISVRPAGPPDQRHDHHRRPLGVLRQAASIRIVQAAAGQGRGSQDRAHRTRGEGSTRARRNDIRGKRVYAEVLSYHLARTAGASASRPGSAARSPRLTPRIRAVIDREQVLHVARLARLRLAEEEVERMAGELSGILDHVDRIGELDLDGVEPTSHVVELENVLRPDEPRPSWPRERDPRAGARTRRRRLPRPLAAGRDVSRPSCSS